MTLEQWAELPEEESGELIDGFLLEEEVPDPVHELAVAWLVVLFGNWLRGKGGFVFGSEVKLRISQERGRKADVVVYLPGRPPPPRRVPVPGSRRGRRLPPERHAPCRPGAR